MINEFPIGSFSNISHYLLMKKAKDLGVTVILGGQGDETFCGYKSLLASGYLTYGKNIFHWQLLFLSSY